MTEKPLVLIIHQVQNQAQEIAKLIDSEYSSMFLSNLEEAKTLYKVVGYKTKAVLIYHKLSQPVSSIIKILRKINNIAEFIILSDHENLNEAVEVMKAGAFDYVVSPFTKWTLIKKINLAIQSIDYTQKIQELSEKLILEQSHLKIKWEYKQNNSDSQFQDNKNDSYYNLESTEKLKEKIKGFQARQFETKTVILIVEDDPSINSILQTLLNKKFIVLSAKDGKECKELLKKQKIDLILLDIYLPDTTGILLMDFIKQYQKGCPVIIMTAFKEIDIAIQALQLGANDYINKPFLKDQLFNSISKCLHINYMQKLLPKLQQWITENVISENKKMSLLQECSQTHLQNNTPLTMKELYAFFPELRNDRFDDNFCVPEDIITEGFLPFLDALKNQKD